ncbi:MAG: DUF2784 family protein [Planctomycetaceae bacterium]|nr:DUF2784 family protein [Planctomycetaceae bacterium]
MGPFVSGILADIVMLCHVLLFVLNLLGHALTVAVVFGYSKWWRESSFWRTTHGAFNLVIIVEACFGWDCPLTTLEKRLRKGSGQQVYAGSFVERLFDGIWNYGAAHVRGPLIWVLVALAVLLAGAHLIAFIRHPPRWLSVWFRAGFVAETE